MACRVGGRRVLIGEVAHAGVFEREDEIDGDGYGVRLGDGFDICGVVAVSCARGREVHRFEGEVLLEGFSQTCAYDRKWATNRWEGQAQTADRGYTADALGRVSISGRFGSGSLSLGYSGLDVEEN